MLYKTVANKDFEIVNLTGKTLPSELKELLRYGANYVPHMELCNCTQKDIYGKDLVEASKKMFLESTGYFPRTNENMSTISNLKLLMIQVPSNSKESAFLETLIEEFSKKLFNCGKKCRVYNKFEKLVPSGTILSVSDKGLGICLLPVEWFIKQYVVQAQKGGHIQTGFSNTECVSLLLKNISMFRADLNSQERLHLKQYFKSGGKQHRIGVLKLIPKIHKLEKITAQSWVDLPSRPIRGAENCPINPYSKVLCYILQDMHKELSKVMDKFPIVYGCDEYSRNIHRASFKSEDWSKITLISGDFSDAYTQSQLNDLIKSIERIGKILHWPGGKISLAKKLSALVFENCYFETPSGIMRQLSGFPMGGHSSREGLDNLLLDCELQILYDDLASSCQYYYRMVDDVSTAVVGDFSNVRKIITLFSKFYPDTMPLNIQISFGYSRFLDQHLLKFLCPGSSFKLTTSLAYKALSLFEYVPYNSNISPRYKGCIVPSFLNRVVRRCTDRPDRQHHIKFLDRMLRHRNQNMTDIKNKFHCFFVKMKNPRSITMKRDYRQCIKITFDATSGIHKLTRSSLLEAYKRLGRRRPLIVYSSLPKVLSHIITKRKLLKRIKSYAVI